MIAQAVITKDHELILMVKQFVERGDIVWNYPGGGNEIGETTEQTCIREVKEETGFDIKLIELMDFNNDKYTYKAEIIGGQLKKEFFESYNKDIIEAQWINLTDLIKFDSITRPIRDLFVSQLDRVPDIN